VGADDGLAPAPTMVPDTLHDVDFIERDSKRFPDTMALEMIGPMPGMLVSRSHPASCFASASISLDSPSIRSSNRRKSTANASMIRSMRGESVSEGVARMRGNSARRE